MMVADQVRAAFYKAIEPFASWRMEVGSKGTRYRHVLTVCASFDTLLIR
jgi:hypothetical protein